jgi:hypothetical protein
LRCLLAALLSCCAIGVHAQSCVTASQVTLTGTLRSANGLPAINNVITLSPSNTGYIAGCGVNIASAVTCATSVDGSVVELQNPLATTTATAQYGSGSLAAGAYFIEFTFYDALGHETLPSPEQSVSLTAAGTINVNAPASGLQASAGGMNIYAGATSGSETLQGSTTGTNSFALTSLASGATPPTSNSTVCAVTANDSMWPVGTGYVVSLTDASGNSVPRFQQQWQLNGAGSTINLSAGMPWYHGVVFYPSPILASPTNHGQQGITGPLSLNGYNLISVGRLGIGTALPAYPLHVVGDANVTGALRFNGAAGTTGQCVTNSSGVPVWGACINLSSLYYQTVQTAGSNMTQRPILDFNSSFTLTDDSGGTRTVVSLTAVAPYVATVSQPSRSVGTIYQNTTGRNLLVSTCPNGHASSNSLLAGSTSGLGITLANTYTSDAGTSATLQLVGIIPISWYYEVTGGSVNCWVETTF